MKNYTTWLKAAIILQLLFACMHTATLFITPLPDNESEKQLFMLMDTYKFDFGAGFQRTMNQLTLVFSTSFGLLYMFGGLTSAYLLRKKADPEIMKGMITINLLVFGICFGVITAYAFLMPIVLSGLIFLFLVLARVTLRRSG